MPMPSGGITPEMVPTCVADLGKEIMIGSGGGIHAHPMGPTVGVRAFRQAIDAAMQGIPLKEYAADRQELAVALGIWEGFFKEATAESGIEAKAEGLAGHEAPGEALRWFTEVDTLPGRLPRAAV